MHVNAFTLKCEHSDGAKLQGEALDLVRCSKLIRKFVEDKLGFEMLIPAQFPSEVVACFLSIVLQKQLTGTFHDDRVSKSIFVPIVCLSDFLQVKAASPCHGIAGCLQSTLISSACFPHSGLPFVRLQAEQDFMARLLRHPHALEAMKLDRATVFAQPPEVFGEELAMSLFHLVSTEREKAAVLKWIVTGKRAFFQVSACNKTAITPCMATNIIVMAGAVGTVSKLHTVVAYDCKLDDLWSWSDSFCLCLLEMI